jgi:sulfonate transport system ATP-binding protein
MHITREETTRVAAVGGARRAAVTLRALSKTYDTRLVLDGIDLTIAPGEFVALVGRSGCGKSTLLRLIAGLEQADGGTMALDGAGRDDALRLMFQEARLLPWKTVLDNVALGRVGRDAARAALEQVGLAARAGEWPSVLSGGQRQRVALARALVHAPGILLLDEPLGALDALTRIDMQQLIESLWQRQGFSAVLVTHDVQEALVLADRVLVIEEGKIAHDLKVDLPRPRKRGSTGFAALERALLERILGVHAE